MVSAIWDEQPGRRMMTDEEYGELYGERLQEYISGENNIEEEDLLEA